MFKDDGDVLNLKMSSKQADVFVNGKRILEETQLIHGDSVVIGFSHYFVVRRLGVDASSSVNLTQIRCDVARSRLTKHKRRQHRHLRLENDVTSAMHYVCEANAIGTFMSSSAKRENFSCFTRSYVPLAHNQHSNTNLEHTGTALKQPIFFKLEQSAEISFEDTEQKEMTLIVARRTLSKKKSQLLFRCSSREFTDSMDRLRALHLFFEPKIPQEFARTMGSLSSHSVDDNDNDTAVPMELPDDEDEEKKQDKTRKLMSKFGDLNVEENAQRALDFVAAMWWWLPRDSNSLMPPHLSAEDTLRRFLRCFQRVPPIT